MKKAFLFFLLFTSFIVSYAKFVVLTAQVTSCITAWAVYDVVFTDQGPQMTLVASGFWDTCNSNNPHRIGEPTDGEIPLPFPDNTSKLDLSISVYPNPSQGFINMKIDDLEVSEPKEVKVFAINSLGEKIILYENQSLSNNEIFNIPTQNLAAGIYYIGLYVGEDINTQVQKIIVE